MPRGASNTINKKIIASQLFKHLDNLQAQNKTQDKSKFSVRLQI
jgi:hypothetical protein